MALAFLYGHISLVSTRCYVFEQQNGACVADSDPWWGALDAALLAFALTGTAEQQRRVVALSAHDGIDICRDGQVAVSGSHTIHPRHEATPQQRPGTAVSVQSVYA